MAVRVSLPPVPGIDAVWSCAPSAACTVKAPGDEEVRGIEQAVGAAEQYATERVTT